MPEMPEVEQVRKTLAPHIEGKKILAVEIMLDRLIKYPSPEKFVEGLVGKTIRRVGRRGKYLVLEVTEDERERVAELVRETMQAAASLEIPLLADVNFGKNWAETK